MGGDGLRIMGEFVYFDMINKNVKCRKGMRNCLTQGKKGGGAINIKVEEKGLRIDVA